jgi:hypothetical protein
MLRRGHVSAGGYVSCSRPVHWESTVVIWSYFDNSAICKQSEFAVSALSCPIYRDIGATIPT